jgi:lactose/L-arabinose transport system ATP-binding protein
MTLADMIVVLRDGRIEQPGTPREVYENPTNIFVAGFIGSPRMNLLAARWEKDGLMYLGKNRIPMPRQSAMPSSGTDITLGIRPEHLVVSTSSEGFLETKVDFTEYLGVTQFLYCQTHEGQAIIAEHRSPAPVSSGDTIHFSWNSAHLRFFDAAGLRVRGNPEGKLTKFQQEDCLFLHLLAFVK